jgi:NarL family two-component system response regulator LiaR
LLAESTESHSRADGMISGVVYPLDLVRETGPVSSVRVLLADNHAILRQGMRTLLEAPLAWQVVANGAEAVEKAAQLKPDVVLLDIDISGIKGTEATREILKAVPQTQVLVLTMHQSDAVLREFR